MQRATAAALLIGGTILLATWLVAPASPSPRSGSDTASADRSPAVPGDTHIAAQKLNAPVAPLSTNVAVRNPFAFGHDQRPGASSDAGVTASAPPAQPLLPRLVAILAGEPSRGTARAAVVSSGDDVEFVHAGDHTGRFVVQRVDADGVVLQDAQSGATYNIPLH